MWGEFVPKLVSKRWVYPFQYGKEVGLEGTDGSLGGIAVVDIWGNYLVVTQPLFSDNTTICSARFIVDNLEVNPVALLKYCCRQQFDGGHF